MFFIHLPDLYRVEANLIVRLFLPENEYAYIAASSKVFELSTSPEEKASWSALFQCDQNHTTEKNKILSANDILMWFDLKKVADDIILQGNLSQNNRLLFREEIPVHPVRAALQQDIKMPLKLMLYKALSFYTCKTLPWGVLTGIRPVKIINKLLGQGDDIEEVTRHMQENYQVSKEKAQLSIEVALNQKKLLKRAPNAISIYIGIPFCTSRCLYCSFPSVSIQHYQYCIQDYLASLKKEIIWASQWIRGNGLSVDTVYIGGGTPTALSVEELKMLLDNIVQSLPMFQVCEYTVEAGRPDTISREKLKVLKSSGVSRISINPQTMQDKTLQLIGRNHTVEQFVEAFHIAREQGFHNINCDLIAGLPGESLEDFMVTIDQMKQLSPESLTVHTMSVKRASRLNEKRERFPNTSDDIVAAMIHLAKTSAKEMGLVPYYLYRQKNILANLENVGYAKPGFEGIYNILIMEEVQSIIALGAGAVSKIVFPNNRIERVFNVKNVEEYMKRIDQMLQRKENLLRYYDVNT